MRLKNTRDSNISGVLNQIGKDMDNKLLKMQDIVKTFPGVKALKGVQLEVDRGEIHAVIGENGAGKSTLMKCLIGIHKPTSGKIFYEGKETVFKNTRSALDVGISMIHQELSPVLHRSIMENIWLGREPRTALGLVDHKKMYQMTVKALKEIDLELDPKMHMSELSVAKIQMIEIAKALSYDAKLIIMDEPTSALTDKEIQKLFELMRQLKEKGIAQIFISHKIEEIYAVCDSVSIYRDGEFIDCQPTADITVAEMINKMVGREVSELYPKKKAEIGDVCIEVEHLSLKGKFEDISFNVRRGEIFGFAGLIGAGRTEVVETIFGLHRPDSGQIKIDGKAFNIKSTEEALASKIAFLTEDRRQTGIFPMLSVFHNSYISSMEKYLDRVGLFSHNKARQNVDQYVEKIRIKTPSIYQRIENLSGGNQQKVLIARWLLTGPEILILDEPTRGIDVGAKSEIHALISDLAVLGKSVIMISSELGEVMGMSDRIGVMFEGKMTAIIDNTPELTQDEIMVYATGQKDQFEATRGVKS